MREERERIFKEFDKRKKKKVETTYKKLKKLIIES
jgi:hypothetical protein